jgi:hypothetical protein
MKTPQNIVASKSANFFIPILLKAPLGRSRSTVKPAARVD